MFATIQPKQQEEVSALSAVADNELQVINAPHNQWCHLIRKDGVLREYFMVFRDVPQNACIRVVPELDTGMSTLFSIFNGSGEESVKIGYGVVSHEGHDVTLVGHTGLYVWSKEAPAARTPVQEKKDFSRWRSPEHEGFEDDDKGYFERYLSVCGNTTTVSHVIPDDSMRLTTLKSGH